MLIMAIPRTPPVRSDTGKPRSASSLHTCDITSTSLDVHCQVQGDLASVQYMYWDAVQASHLLLMAQANICSWFTAFSPGLEAGLSARDPVVVADAGRGPSTRL
jgi:hypothetical protein